MNIEEFERLKEIKIENSIWIIYRHNITKLVL